MAVDAIAVMSLIKFLPDIISLFDKKRGKQASEAFETVGKIAERVTGKPLKEAEEALSADPAKAYAFQMEVMGNELIQRQLEVEDRKSARELSKVDPAQASRVADQIMKYNLVLVFVLVMINVLAVIYLREDAAVLAIISNFIGIVLHALLQERQSVTAFYFGSSLGSKLKETLGVNKS